MQYDAKLIKKSLSIADYKHICKALGIPVYTENPETIIYYTGDKNVNPYNGSPKLYFYKSSGIYVSYTGARSYDVFALVQTRLGLLNKPHSFVDALNFIQSVVGEKVADFRKTSTITQQFDWEKALGKYLRVRKGELNFPHYNPTILKQFDNIFPKEWLAEGISKDTLTKFSIEYYPYLNATIIPVFDYKGELCGIRCRHWRPDEIAEGKYRPLTLLDGTTYKFPTSSLLYGLNFNQYTIADTNTVWLCEGEKAVMKLDTWFGQQSCAVSMFGKHLGTQRRNQLLKLGVKKIIYIPDNDAKGKDSDAVQQWENEIKMFCNSFRGYVDSIEIVYDNMDLLEPKQNATDKDYKTWELLFNNREILN